MGIVQRKSIASVGSVPSLSLAFDSPVTAGNRIIVAVRIGFTSLSSVSDGTNTYFIAADYAPFPQHLSMYSAIAAATAGITVEVHAASDTPINLHIYEASGYSGTQDQHGQNSQSGTQAASVSTGDATVTDDQFVLAMFASSFGSGIAWTAGAGYGGGETTEGAASVFSEGGVVSSTGVQTATAHADFAGDLVSIIATWKSGGSPTPPPPSGSNFLGSVRVLGSAPAGRSNPFLGTVTVVSGAPAGKSNPYLGSVVVGTPGPSNSNPALGEVVVVTDAPAGNSDPFLGSVVEG